MLVVSRKKGESLRIGSSIVRVVKIGRDKVRLAVEADPETQIMRTEVEERLLLAAAEELGDRWADSMGL